MSTNKREEVQLEFNFNVEALRPSVLNEHEKSKKEKQLDGEVDLEAIPLPNKKCK